MALKLPELPKPRLSRAKIRPFPVNPGISRLPTLCHLNQHVTDRKKLSNDFNDANDAFIDEVLKALQASEIPQDLARAYLAHPVAMMHSDGAQAVADYFDRMLAQRPNIDWMPGG